MYLGQFVAGDVHIGALSLNLSFPIAWMPRPPRRGRGDSRKSPPPSPLAAQVRPHSPVGKRRAAA